MRPKYDMLWKGLMDELMGDLLLFVEPEIGKELVKIFLRNGSERWMLLHIEVQGNNERDFARRMFEYYIQIFSKHGRPVAAIALMTGKVGGKMSAVYEDRCLWMRSRYEYKMLNIADYPDEMLEASMNPFAIM